MCKYKNKKQFEIVKQPNPIPFESHAGCMGGRKDSKNTYDYWSLPCHTPTWPKVRKLLTTVLFDLAWKILDYF